ncbi:MAG: response regulator transcription factor [Terrimicrobiaceae bacterium]|nr:response regulator transcription factor [Terrimicrobiaceae bacterium]
MKPAKKKIFIVDDHPLVRERLTELIDREADLMVCGEAEDRSEAFAAILEKKPFLVLLDFTLKSSHGIDLIKDLRAAAPEIRLLVVSMHDELLYAERCLRAGAHGYITKQQASRHVMQAIRRVLDGDLYLSDEVSKQLVERSLGAPRGRRSDSIVSNLADRELQVFELIGQGWSTRQIAESLSIDPKTIDTYRARIREKLGLKNSAELLQQAIAWTQRPEERP